ncbi:DNA-binding response regulator, NarL/FixJ family, contains REC and HTH domains [Soonwooa buanensis]|uniref:DNA-binding response regulator, NarL/FixJ family, contains REC and HTH domains n=1 Tax=Soonwooa buanensis TaxID=619805 RepID=A0A1T5G7B4_9FLAO|nr:response regulator [Soonwooa buanensis]SKC04272.1 DNA-binding response regulator, NarL/FixJ family, contains REC and HTH domains [Soonwooa buanensis]
MFKKILVAEDYESANISVQKALDDLKIPNPTYVSYCDDALVRIKTSLSQEEYFELLITDLSFDEDHRQQNIRSGQELISAIREIQPHLKVIVFSGQKKEVIIEKLFEDQKINAYVKKGRNDVKDLKKAIISVFNNEKYISYDLKTKSSERNSYEFSNYDITLVSLLANGILLKDIPEYLKENSITPSSKSAVEKRLKDIKDSLDINSNEQLIAFCKDFGII